MPDRERGLGAVIASHRGRRWSRSDAVAVGRRRLGRMCFWTVLSENFAPAVSSVVYRGRSLSLPIEKDPSYAE